MFFSHPSNRKGILNWSVDPWLSEATGTRKKEEWSQQPLMRPERSESIRLCHSERPIIFALMLFFFLLITRHIQGSLKRLKLFSESLLRLLRTWGLMKLFLTSHP